MRATTTTTPTRTSQTTLRTGPASGEGATPSSTTTGRSRSRTGPSTSVYTERLHTGYKHAKGGIMIRDTNDPDAAHAFVGMSGYYNGVTFQTRAEAGALAVHHQTNFVQYHQAWIRLS